MGSRTTEKTGIWMEILMEMLVRYRDARAGMMETRESYEGIETMGKLAGWEMRIRNTIQLLREI